MLNEVSKIRTKCKIMGCKRLCRNKGFYKGNIRYDNVCSFHHKKTEDIPAWFKRQPNLKCEVCGWDKSYCDRHRIVPNKGYIDDNVKILCPNCHRLATIGLLKFQNEQNLTNN